jgi:hypothetical protein
LVTNNSSFRNGGSFDLVAKQILELGAEIFLSGNVKLSIDKLPWEKSVDNLSVAQSETGLSAQC